MAKIEKIVIIEDIVKIEKIVKIGMLALLEICHSLPITGFIKHNLLSQTVFCVCVWHHGRGDSTLGWVKNALSTRIP